MRRYRFPLLIFRRHQSTTSSLPRSASEDLSTLRAALRGTVPAHQALLLLHTKTPPEEWPTNVGSVSPLLHEIQAHIKEFNGKVLMCYPGDDEMRSKATHLITSGRYQDYRHYTGTFFTKLTPPFDIPLLNKDLLPQFLRFFKARMQTGVNVASVLPGASGTDYGAAQTLQARSLLQSSILSQQVDRKRVKKTWILVCTHGARDCRCGDRGSVVVRLMREYLRAKPALAAQVVIGEVSHVGGHRYAPNILVYPHGEWYGTLQPEQVESFMDSLLAAHDESLMTELEGKESLSGPSSPLWRGSWFDHPGTPTRLLRDTHEDPGVRQVPAQTEDEQRALARARLELMRDERELNASQNLAEEEGEWGTDLDRLGRGG
ncbi:hypothetical protein M408DRAFT_24150 [Serendipita vermifera MAFF 305830]|uniref:Sucrase/ferredoxin-like-domain-containing protein n=1 Tax=Serendipita vermifera MAFF 305830 TaxID=933852 RepID=A0A0C2XF57_SERVB|nr:hypothetical protein M408DRAFT_24150 [Serendipita vermifera MAFF 305830]